MEGASPRRIEPQRARAALALLDRHERSLRRLARRLSICSEDAEDAYQRAVLILLTKGPAGAPARRAAWMHVVTRREALAVRHARERLLAPPPEPRPAGREGVGCPVERLEGRERVGAAAAWLARLKPDERTAIVLHAEGYSYAEICERTGWTYTEVNRCLVEGRARLRALGAMD